MKRYLFLFFSFYQVFAQNDIFITPYVGGNFIFCQEFASYPEYRVRTDFWPVSTFGLSLIYEKKKIAYLIGFEFDDIGYATYEQRSIPPVNNFSSFQNTFVVKKRSSRNEYNRINALVKLPLLSQKKDLKVEKSFYQKTFFLTGLSFNWSSFDFEPNDFVSSNIVDTLTMISRRNLSLWIGTNFEFFNKKKRLFNVQIHLKKGFGGLFNIWRYDLFTREIVQMITVRGTTLSVTLGVPIRIKSF